MDSVVEQRPVKKEKKAGKGVKPVAKTVPQEFETVDIDVDINAQALLTSNRLRRSSVAMTKYEHAKIIGMRAEQIARGAQPFVSDEITAGGRFDPIAIANRELNAGVLPFIVVRNLPDGTHEKWRLRDFIMPF